MVALALNASFMAAVVLLQADTGSSYWQQHVHYTITAQLDEPSGVLWGSERVRYRNASPDTLREIYFHLYLNAFRPASRWAARDSIEGRMRFNRLRDPDYAFNHVANVRVDGRPVVGEYPYAPDSTVVRFPLPRAVVPGDSLVVEMEWDARPSTLPRRQGRRGRRFDFAQWYPRVVVYDRFGWQAHPLYPAGEFYGEFGTFDVTLDLPADQVVGATGVPIEGDPGWQRARAHAGVPVTYQRDWYGARPVASHDAPGPAPPPGGRGCRWVNPGAGRKCVRFYAEDVHHFALSLNPQYVYEEGRYKDVVVRVLYLPEDRDTWGNGVAVERTVEALRWLDTLFGPYPWPQLTNVHRIEGGGTEFPMMVMNGGAGFGLILHEVGHNYLMGVLANNEWKEGFLDEGFTSFQTAWYFEEHVPGYDAYSGLERFMLDLDLDGWTQPTSFVSEDYRDFATYNAMIYTRGHLFFHQLRYIVGDDVMRRVLREYYARWKLKHVSESALLDVAEEVSGQDLKTFFAQWLHGAPLYDYAVGDVRRRRLDDGTWETTVDVRRLGDGIIPVEIGELPAGGGAPVIYARASGRPERDRVTFRSARRPGRLMLDPRRRTHDWNYLNNREHRLLDLTGRAVTLDTYVSDAHRRDRFVHQVAPSVWYNDAGGLTVGLRMRSNYLGRFARSTLWVTRGVSGDEPTTTPAPLDVYVSVENPIQLHRPRTRVAIASWSVEGRTGASVRWEAERRRSWADARRVVVGWTGTAMATRNREFLDPALWDDGGTVELARTYAWDWPQGATRWAIHAAMGAGVAYAERAVGLRLDRRYEAEPFGRATVSAAVRREVATGWRVGARGFAGGYLAAHTPLRQRAIALHGADPYQTFVNPLIRSHGAVFVRPEFFYHAPGNGNLRGYQPGRAGRWLLAANAEIERDLYRGRRGVVRSVGLVAFADVGLADSLAVPAPTGAAAVSLSDAGLGVRVELAIGDRRFPLRLEAPLYVSRPLFAHNRRQGTDPFEFRWLLSVEPIF